jgi:ribonuclease R
MTYDDINSILEKNTVPTGYEAYKGDLLVMKDLSQILRKMRVERGEIDFDIDEFEILVDENGEPYDIVIRYRGVAEKLIEDFMIVTNESVATHLNNLGIPVMFRVHGEPDTIRLLEFVEFIKSLGYKVNIDLKKITPKKIQELLNSLRDKKEFPILSSQILRCMEKAVYSETNIGHFAIASNRYLHFTSPIRRFEDLGDHIIIRKFLIENKFDEETFLRYEKKVPVWALQASVKERDADQSERDADALYAAKYMEKFIGEQYHAMISSVTNFGIFVRLDNQVEGLVPMDELGDYTYNEKLQSLIDKNKRIGYRLCDEIDVELTRVSIENSTIDFKVIKRNDHNGKAKEKVKIKNY